MAENTIWVGGKVQDTPLTNTFLGHLLEHFHEFYKVIFSVKI